MDFLSLAIHSYPELLNKLWQQLYLVMLSTSIATFVGVPLGMYLANKAKMSRIVLAIASVIQTIPSLALLAFLLPILGIGSKPAIVALTLYALLPILRNSVVAMQAIPESLQETSRSLGFSRWKQFYLIELPLALPMIIAGIRVAVVMNIATATLAAFIGAGGLGDFINQGLALGNHNLLFLGAVPAFLLAILLDGLLGMCESIFKVPPKCKKWWNSLSCKVSVLVVFVTLFSSFFSFMLFDQHVEKQNPITIASKNFTEQIILGEMISQLIEAKTTIPVIRKFNLGSTQVCQAALLRKEIDIYPEYTGSAYLIVLHGEQRLSPQDLYQYVSSTYFERFRILWLPTLGFNNTEALAVRFADERLKHVHTISELVLIAPHLCLGAPSEFLGRPDGVPGLQKDYNLSFHRIVEMDPCLMYKALKNGSVDVISAFSTDGRILAYDLRLLIDDRRFFPSYDACFLVREDAVVQFPELVPILHLLDGKISDIEMQKLNDAVDEKKEMPEAVAKAFLEKKGLL